MQDKKIVLLPLMLMIALGISGVAFAHWSDYVEIVGTVDMGTLEVVFYPEEPDCVEKWDNEGILQTGEYKDKDVGGCDIYFDPESEVWNKEGTKRGFKKVIWEIENAYPSYRCHYVNVRLWNIGEVPAHFVDIIITGYDNTDKENLGFEWVPGYEHEKGVFTNDVDNDGDNENIINVEIVNFVCTQLDPCHDTKGEIDLHFKQDAEECHTYTFEIYIVAVQFNKWREYTPGEWEGPPNGDWTD